MFDKLEQIFHKNFFSRHNGRISLVEKDPNATKCTKADILYNDEILSFDTEVLQLSNKFYRKGSILRFTCDGALIILNKKSEGRYFLSLIEFKDTLSQPQFKKALKQLDATLVKVFNLLETIEGIEIEKIDPVYFIMGTFEDNIERKVNAYREYEVEGKSDFRSVQELFYELMEKDTFQLKFQEGNLNHTAVKKIFYRDTIPVFHTCCNKEVDLSKYI